MLLDEEIATLETEKYETVEPKKTKKAKIVKPVNIHEEEKRIKTLKPSEPENIAKPVTLPKDAKRTKTAKAVEPESIAKPAGLAKSMASGISTKNIKAVEPENIAKPAPAESTDKKPKVKKQPKPEKVMKAEAKKNTKTEVKTKKEKTAKTVVAEKAKKTEKESKKTKKTDNKDKNNKERKSGKGRVAKIIITLLIVAIPVFLFLRYYTAFDGFIKKIAKPEETSEQKEEEEEEEKIEFAKTPILVYISGSDSRVGVSDKNARSDVNIIAAVNPTTSKILLVSIPRDYYVQLHETSGLKDKLTHAGIYGIDMSKQTIEDLMDIKINDTIKVGFDALQTIVDAIDGIDIYSDQNLYLRNGECTFTGGVTQHINGICALAFSRERKSYATGDRHRGENQQQVISKILAKITTPAYILKMPEILAAADGLFETSFSHQEILDMVKFQVFSNPNWETESISLDGTGGYAQTYSAPGQNLYVMFPDEASITTAKEKITQYLKTTEQLEAEAEEKAAEQEADNNNTKLTE